MVGIYAKIKNGLNWLKGKAAKYVAPIIGTVGDIANNPFVKGAASFASPFLDSIAPGLGTGINTGLSWLGKAGDVANGLNEDYKVLGDDFSIGDMFTNVVSGKYTKGKNVKKVPDGIKYAKRPDELNSRIQLKALPSPEGANRSGSYVEELD